MAQDGIRCPRCGCADLRGYDGRPWRTVKTLPIPGAIRRYRICRNCGRRVRTREIIDNSAEPGQQNETDSVPTCPERSRRESP